MILHLEQLSKFAVVIYIALPLTSSVAQAEDAQSEFGMSPSFAEEVAADLPELFNVRPEDVQQFEGQEILAEVIAKDPPQILPGTPPSIVSYQVGKYCRDTSNASPMTCIQCVDRLLPGGRPNSSIRFVSKWAFCNGLFTPWW